MFSSVRQDGLSVARPRHHQGHQSDGGLPADLLSERDSIHRERLKGDMMMDEVKAFYA